MATLRDYQQHALAGISASYAAGHRRVLLVSPTGSGKAVMIAAAAATAVARQRRVIILAHRKELIGQLSEKVAAVGLPHGVVIANRDTDPTQAVQVASIPTIAARLRKGAPVPPADLIVIDEAHHTTKDNSYAAIVAAYPGAYLLGASASPWRLDGKGLGDVFTSSVLAATPADLIARGFLAPFAGFAFDSPALHGLQRRAGDYAPRGLELLMHAPKLAGNIIACWLRRAAGRPTILFACSRAHAADLADRFTAAGVAAASVDGGMPAALRDERIAAFRAGRLTVLTSVSLLTEGFDLPSISCVVMARPTLSLTVYLQQVGRALRPAPGKTALLVDHAGNVAIHGLPDAPRDYSLTATVRGKLASADAPTSLRTCGLCFAIFPDAARCPACGEVMAARPRPLAEIEAEEIALAEAVARGRARETKYGATLAELVATGRAKDFQPGWALVRFKQRFGRWPTKAERQAADEMASQQTEVA